MEEFIKRVTENIKKLLCEKDFVLVAIDGRCCAGKTTLATELNKRLPSNVIHMDDFFLRPYQRTEERLKIPGGNVDYERFFCEVLSKAYENSKFSYRPYDCTTQSLKEQIKVLPKPVTIIEGSYACHPMLRKYYDYIIFMDIDSKMQLERIIKRNGREAIEMFKSKWIPLEEMYFEAYPVNANISFTSTV